MQLTNGNSTKSAVYMRDLMGESGQLFVTLEIYRLDFYHSHCCWAGCLSGSCVRRSVVFIIEVFWKLKRI